MGLAVTFASTTRKFEGCNSYEFYFSNKIAYIPIPTASRMGKSQVKGEGLGGGAELLPVCSNPNCVLAIAIMQLVKG